MTVYYFVHVLSADLDASFTTYYGNTALKVGVKHSGGIVDGSHSAIDEAEVDDAGIFEAGTLLVIEIGEYSVDVGDVTKHPLHDIHKVTELGEQCSAIEIAGSFPGSFFVVAVVTVPETVELHEEDITEAFVLDNLFEPF